MIYQTDRSDFSICRLKCNDTGSRGLLPSTSVLLLPKFEMRSRGPPTTSTTPATPMMEELSQLIKLKTLFSLGGTCARYRVKLNFKQNRILFKLLRPYAPVRLDDTSRPLPYLITGCSASRLRAGTSSRLERGQSVMPSGA